MLSLTVIVPFFDETAFIKMAIGSIVGQGIADLEILIVNDNPDAFAPEYFDSLGFPDNVRVLHQPRNMGLSAARNAGLAQAKGDHIAFLDADDYYVAGGLAAHLTFARQSGADMTHAQTYLSRIGSPQISILPRDARMFSENKIRKGLRDCENAQFITSSWSSLYRRDFLDRANLRFDEEQVKFEDRLFVLSAVTAAESIAQLGQPVRVWRRRAGSISNSAPDPKIHLLQVQLLEKCLAVMADWSAQTNAPPRFFKREIYNTLARLIWDLDIIGPIAQGDDPFYRDLGVRLTRLLADDGLGQTIFDDPLIAEIDRVGMTTRRGFVTRRAFFDVQRGVKKGDYASIAATLAASPVAPAAAKLARLPVKVILHLGMHKTGTTALQKWCIDQAESLAKDGVLFPRTGLPDGTNKPIRDDGLPGHQGLMAAINLGTEEAVWGDLAHEIRQSGAKTIILSCENFLMPLRDDRADAMPRLLAQLDRFSDFHPIAFVRRADVALDRYYREVVGNGGRSGSRSMAEFRVDYEPVLTDLPSLFAPFETVSGRAVQLIDYDATLTKGGVIAAFQTATGINLAQGTGASGDHRKTYAALSRELVQGARLINTMLAAKDRREAALRDFFRSAPIRSDRDDLFVSPQDRSLILTRFQEKSALWAAERGYAPDYDALQSELVSTQWSPLPPLPADIHEAVINSTLRTETESNARGLPQAPTVAPDPANRYAITFRLRPWAVRLIRRFRR